MKELNDSKAPPVAAGPGEDGFRYWMTKEPSITNGPHFRGNGTMWEYSDCGKWWPTPDGWDSKRVTEDPTWTECTESGTPLPAAGGDDPDFDHEYLAELIHRVRVAAGNNAFTIELCGSLAVICKMAIGFSLQKQAPAVALEGETERLRAEVQSLTERGRAHAIESEKWRAKFIMQRQEAQSDTWMWMGDEFDTPESLACPVLMRLEHVREFVKAKAELAATVGALKPFVKDENRLRFMGDKDGRIYLSVTAEEYAAALAGEGGV